MNVSREPFEPDREVDWHKSIEISIRNRFARNPFKSIKN